MARARNLKPGFFRNEQLVDLPFEYRLLFQGLWLLADREGRLLDRPKTIKMEIFPADGVDVNAGLQALHDAGLVERYTVGENRYISVTTFKKHQNPHVREPESEIPAPDQHSAGTVPAPDQHSAGPAESPLLNPLSTKTSSSELRPDAAIQSPGGEKWGTQEDLKAAEYLQAKVLTVSPGAREPNWAAWANDIRLMRERDKRSHREICELFAWANADPFWKANILSPSTLREKWTQLDAKRRNAAQGPPAGREASRAAAARSIFGGADDGQGGSGGGHERDITGEAVRLA